MSSSSTDSGTSPPPILDEELAKPVSGLVKRAKPTRPARKLSGSESTPLIIAAYRHGDPEHKRRVKVPAHIPWNEFLTLLSSRLEVGRDCEISTYDENGIEIVSVEDLVPNDVLVVKEHPATDYSRTSGFYPRTKQSDERGHSGGSLLRRPEDTHSVTTVTSRKIHQAPPAGTPLLTHFIKANHFGYYFLAEIDAHRLGGREGGGGEEGGWRKRTHCVVKVPSCDKSSDASRIFEVESSLLRKVSGHRSIITAPTIQILNFANEFLQLFFSHLPEHKQPPLTELFFSGTCSEAYIYPLYGVTMATKIKSGLTPERAVRYAYQLADTMYYLQQRGVIHQTLLPENIQVMSNDRVMVCNFETAVQTDPTTCTLLISHSMVAPSNRMGLSPEVLNVFNRGDAGLIDYSTQYPWNFGSLSVIMTTGMHPLKNYPGRYLIEGKVKYRSHNYQCLPDVNKYPSLFCRLVKRSLSCDPLRRPSLFQITSIMKKDSRTLTMMSSSNRGKSSSVVSSPGVGSKSIHRRDSGREHIDLEHSGEQGAMVHKHRHHPAQPHESPSIPAHEQTVPSKRTKTELQQTQFVDSLMHPTSRHHGQDVPHWTAPRGTDMISTYQTQRSRDSHVKSHDNHVSPRLSRHAPSQQFSQSYNASRQVNDLYPPGSSTDRGSRPAWSDVGSNRITSHLHRTSPEIIARQLPASGSIIPQRRVSSGGFSDDFNPLGRNLPPVSPGHKSSASGDVTQSQSSVRYGEVLQALREQRMNRKRSSATSDSDGNGMLTGETEYQRLLPEYSADELLTNQNENESTTNRAKQPVSGQDNQRQSRRPQLPIRSYEASRRSLKKPTEQVEFRRASSLQQSSGVSMISSLGSRRCFSDSETRVGDYIGGSLHSSPSLPPRYTHPPRSNPQLIPWNTFAREIDHSTPNTQSQRAQVGEQGTEGVIIEVVDGEPMQVSPVTTATFEISDKFSDVSTSAQVGGRSDERMTGTAVEMIDSNLRLHQNQTFHAIEDYPPSGNDSTVTVSKTDQQWNNGNLRPQVNELQMECETFNSNINEQFNPTSSAMEPEVTSHTHEEMPTAQQWSSEGQNTTSEPSQSNIPRNPAVTTVYSGPHIMSPIAEVSQEFSTQQTTTQTLDASQTQHTQFTQSMHSLSPLPEQTNEPEMRRSSSPFRHDALGDAVSAVLSPSTVSDNTNTSIVSQVGRVFNRPEMPQLEPPSTSSETSHTRSSEVDSSTHGMTYPQPPATGEDLSTSLNAFVEHDRTSSTTPTNALISTQFLPQTMPPAVGDASERSSQITPTPEISSVTFPLASTAAVVQSQHRPDYHHNTPSSRDGSQGKSLQSSGNYQSSVSTSSRERYGGHVSSALSTVSAPPVGYNPWNTRRIQRSTSPTGTNAPSALSDSVTVRFRAARKTNTSSHSHDQNEPVLHRSLGRHRRHHASTGSSGGNGSRQHHAAQRISQDLEMMTRAIEGMDSVNPAESVTAAARDERLNSSHSPTPSQAPPSSNRTGRPRPVIGVPRPSQQNRYSNNDSRLAYRAFTNARASSLVQPSSQNVSRTNTPADLNRSHSQNDGSAHNFPFRQSPNPSSSLVALSQIPPNDSPDSIDHLVRTQNLAQSGTPLTHGESVVLSPVQFPSAMPMNDNYVSNRRDPVSLPPQPEREYLPPYSPPRTEEVPQANQTNQQGNTTVVQDNRPVYRDPPPSYEEIFGQQNGRRQRQRQRRPSRQSRRQEEAQQGGSESQSQQDNASHRSSHSSRHRKLPSLTSLFRRSRRHTHTTSSATSPADPGRIQPPHQVPTPMPVSDPLEERAQVAPREDQRQTNTTEPFTLERTASWVASYSQTPRPINAYQQLERGFRDFRAGDEVSSVSAGGIGAHSTVHSQLSRTVSDTAAMTTHSMNRTSHSQPTHAQHQPLALSPTGAPSYRHPPPFLHSPSSQDPGIVLLQRPSGYALSPQDTNTQPPRQTTGYALSPQDTNTQPPRQTTGYALSPQDTNTQPPRQTTGYALSPQDTNTQPSRQTTGYALSPQDVSVQPSRQTSHTDQDSRQTTFTTTPSPGTPQSISTPITPYLRPLVRSRGNPLNLSQPNININSLNSGSRGESSSPSSPQQAPIFHRVLAHPPRARPISSLVTSAEYGRIGTSMTSVASPLNSDLIDSRAVLVSAIERLRNNERSEGREGRVSGSSGQQNGGEEQLPQTIASWQLSQTHDSNTGESLGVNGNANNDNPSPKSPEASPNATPRSSPITTRRITSTSAEHTQNQTQTEENGVLHNGSETTASSGATSRKTSGAEKPQLQKSTQRSRAASRRLAQQLSSSDEDLAVGSSSSASSHGQTRHRRKRGDGSSRSSSRQGNKSQNCSFASPINLKSPVFFPSFQSQTTTDLPQDGIFSTLSSDLAAQSTLTPDVVVSHDSHMISQSQNQQAILLSQDRNGQPNTEQAQEEGSHDFNTTSAVVSHDHSMKSPGSDQQVMSQTPAENHEASHDHNSDVTSRSHDHNCDVTTGSHDHNGDVTANMNGTEGLPTTSPATSSTLSETHHPEQPTTTPSKPCGHVCVSLSQREVCCQCVQFMDNISDLFQSCEICERRLSVGQDCNCAPNKPDKFCPVHQSSGQNSLPTPIDAHPSSHNHNRKHIKNCIVM